MSTLFGPVHQIGYVVKDIKAAMHHWTDVLCVGPFFYIEGFNFERLVYKGKPCEVDIAIAWAYSGDLQIELIQVVRPTGPNMFSDFFEAHGEGMHHLSFWTQEFEKDKQRALDCGYTILAEGQSTADGRFVHFEQLAHTGALVELTEVRGIKQGIWEHLHDLSETWGGEDPIRILGG